MLEKQTYSIFLCIGRMQSKEPQERGKEGLHPCFSWRPTHAIDMNHFEISIRMNCFMTACFPVQLWIRHGVGVFISPLACSKISKSYQLQHLNKNGRSKHLLSISQLEMLKLEKENKGNNVEDVPPPSKLESA